MYEYSTRTHTVGSAAEAPQDGRAESVEGMVVYVRPYRSEEQAGVTTRGNRRDREPLGVAFRLSRPLKSLHNPDVVLTFEVGKRLTPMCSTLSALNGGIPWASHEFNLQGAQDRS